MTVEELFVAGLCTQCGTCAGICPAAAISLSWECRIGYRLRVDQQACIDCGSCLAVCPAEGFDYTEGAGWRARNGDAPAPDFLGPWRRLWFGWAADEQVRYSGASGGVATAILQGSLASGDIDAAVVCRVDPANSLAVEPVLARTPDEVAVCRGSKYNVAAVNLLLRRLLDEPGHYAVVGLPCHLQGLRKAQDRYVALRDRVAFTLGIFCGWTATPRATEVTARRVGLDADELTSVRYRGPGWPGGMRLETRAGVVRELPYPAYFDRLMYAYTPPRCRLCPDALAELADISVGDAWLERFKGSAGVSDVIARTPEGEDVLGRLVPRHLTLTEATPEEILRSQVDTYAMKRPVFRGRLWLRGLSGRRTPTYPGISARPSLSDRLRGVGDLVNEVAYRAVGDLRFRRPAPPA